MLFSVIYHRRLLVDDEAMKQVHRLFMAWEPPPDFSIRFHYVFASGGRDLAVVEAPDASLIREATAPFTRALDLR
ncbi:MAG: hypothetical protein GEU75_14190 [Dehalococcoidia bacterium]|nr:hypothetical protein [Dehalococcoidia bacterium]